MGWDRDVSGALFERDPHLDAMITVCCKVPSLARVKQLRFFCLFNNKIILASRVQCLGAISSSIAILFIRLERSIES